MSNLRNDSSSIASQFNNSSSGSGVTSSLFARTSSGISNGGGAPLAETPRSNHVGGISPRSLSRHDSAVDLTNTDLNEDFEQNSLVTTPRAQSFEQHGGVPLKEQLSSEKSMNPSPALSPFGSPAVSRRSSLGTTSPYGNATAAKRILKSTTQQQQSSQNYNSDSKITASPAQLRQPNPSPVPTAILGASRYGTLYSNLVSEGEDKVGSTPPGDALLGPRSGLATPPSVSSSSLAPTHPLLLQSVSAPTATVNSRMVSVRVDPHGLGLVSRGPVGPPILPSRPPSSSSGNTLVVPPSSSIASQQGSGGDSGSFGDSSTLFYHPTSANQQSSKTRISGRETPLSASPTNCIVPQPPPPLPEFPGQSFTSADNSFAAPPSRTGSNGAAANSQGSRSPFTSIMQYPTTRRLTPGISGASGSKSSQMPSSSSLKVGSGNVSIAGTVLTGSGNNPMLGTAGTSTANSSLSSFAPDPALMLDADTLYLYERDSSASVLDSNQESYEHTPNSGVSPTGISNALFHGPCLTPPASRSPREEQYHHTEEEAITILTFPSIEETDLVVESSTIVDGGATRVTVSGSDEDVGESPPDARESTPPFDSGEQPRESP